MERRRSKVQEEREPTCGNKSIAIMYTNYSALNTKRHPGYTLVIIMMR